METGFDGGVLEISINGGAFQDIIAAGGYVRYGRLQRCDQRQLRLTRSLVEMLGPATLPGSSRRRSTYRLSANGGNIRLRWRRGTDSSVSGQGWRIDSITLDRHQLRRGDLQPLTCPANITVSRTIRTSAARWSTTRLRPRGGLCGTLTCSPASGSFFPVGTTTVTCTTTGPPQRQCTFTITVS